MPSFGCMSQKTVKNFESKYIIKSKALGHRLPSQQWCSGLTAPRALAVPIFSEIMKNMQLRINKKKILKKGENLHSFLWLH